MRALRFARNPCAIHSANCRAADCTVDRIADRIAEIDASDSIVSNGVSNDASSDVSSNVSSDASSNVSNDAVVALALGNAGSTRGTAQDVARRPSHDNGFGAFNMSAITCRMGDCLGGRLQGRTGMRAADQFVGLSIRAPRGVTNGYRSGPRCVNDLERTCES